MTAQHEITGDAPIAVYRLYDAPGTLLYVGVTDNPTARFAEHAKVKPWWPAVARKTMAWHDSRTEALEAETLAIASEQPLHNHAGRPKAPGIRGKDRHKRAPVRVRLREPDHIWLLEHATETGRPINAILADALTAYRANLSGPTTQAEPPPPPEVVEDAITTLEARPRNCKHHRMRMSKGVCPDCHQWATKPR